MTFVNMVMTENGNPYSFTYLSGEQTNIIL
jgi:hypothetical protein